MNKPRWIAAGGVAAGPVAFSVGVYAGVTERLQNTVSSAQVTIPGTTITLQGGPDGSAPSDVDFSKFWQAWNLLQDNFVQTHASGTIPTYQERVYGAIAGLTSSYGDPYTVFLPPSDAKQFNDDINGSFTVVSPLKGSPAGAAGVRSGDVIIGIDNKPSEKMPVDEAVRLIRGEIGTSVTILLKRAGVAEPFEVKIVRQTIQIPVINTYARGDGIFVIELYSFSENSTDLFRGALRTFFESGATKLILDLRGNPGGYLDAAVQMASYFLPVGDVIVTGDFVGQAGQGSASASEILAGALQQHGVAKLVGTRRFGKGSVQQLMQLGGGAELKVTIAR